MSNPTSNFGWQMPTNSDLVTDLPADFEVFGQGVDTTLADLKGGTSGQILSKNTNADMDFVWINNDQGDITGVTATSPLTGGGTSGAITVGIQSASTTQSGAVQLTDSTSSTSTSTAATPNSVKSAYDLANTANTTANTANSTANAAIPKSTVTAKGSIVTATASSTPAQLAVGSNGYSLVADSSASTGLNWAGNQAAGKNAIINGGFDWWQRSTSSSTLGAYTTADRWYLGAYSGTGTFAQETTVVPSGSRYSLKFTASATSQPYAYQAIETANAQQFAGQTVTLSMKLAASTSVGVAIGLEYSTSVDNGVAGSWTGITPSAGGTATPSSTTFITGTGTFAVPSTAKSLRVGLYTTSTIANTVVVYLGQAQLELGSSATTFSRAGGTIQGELAACQRYYEKSYIQGTNPGSVTNSGAFYGTRASGGWSLSPTWKVTKRTTPTVTVYSTATGTSGKIRNRDLGTDETASIADACDTAVYVSGTGATAGVLYSIQWEASAEL